MLLDDIARLLAKPFPRRQLVWLIIGVLTGSAISFLQPAQAFTRKAAMQEPAQACTRKAAVLLGEVEGCGEFGRCGCWPYQMCCCDADGTFRGCCIGVCCYNADGTVGACCPDGGCCASPEGDAFC